ncbi:carbohydrate ABC transporter permease [Actinomyces urogenitalis]|jgi:multiple sugar transport system permease protein/raffinose/stachyose/melibiose transport system permease protein|uniref:ABC superfamily ATP binding cassette transporter, membrane protein n=2 Tax=Actinomyces urogenitalis TaxID=103621 RepID=W1VAY9_9ACTO|nr:sugar ABC transporter permease [Actinomyces urogenitalis]ETJ02015.1 MAG: ABC superfamily ATP binding cassette transporter, membrane protein [Actinomyces urogenitalis DORA_12]MDK8236832.1 sugar ABC transporter permease [Actinomyces urogenitalis]MDU5428102.1 sugar ABC transporter permease [Actinomyces urogenitalis]MDU5874855.1 sugar ABC transporter permease [Actinomyces urogenitalis]WOO94895.1 sugar ABC transporter permease [Actinomyces urogenitalis]
MSSPALILLLLFMGIPILLTFGLSFTNARLISPNPPSFVGLANFERALGADPTFLRSLTNTAFFALIVVPCQSGLALALAILVNQKVKGVTAFRTMIFMPVVTSMVVVSILWSFFYEDDGLVNSMLNTITGGGWTAVAWLNNPGTAMPAIIVLSIWQAVGLHMIIWLSGLQGIDPALYEAADLDGVNGWQRFRYVTWPGLRSTMVFILVTITIAALGLFVQVDVMTSGGPQDATSTLVYHAVRKGYREQDMGYGSAISLIFFVCVLLISLIQRRLTREKD